MINEQILKKHLMTLVETNYITYDHVTDRYMYRNAIIWIKPYSKYHRIELIVMVNNHVTSQMLHYGDTIKALDLLFYIILNTNHQPM